MVILKKDGLVEEQPPSEEGTYRCYAEVSAESLEQQSNLLDKIISFAFDRVGARRLEVRVLDAKAVCAGSACLDA